MDDDPKDHCGYSLQDAISLKVVHVITGLNQGGAETSLYRLCKASEQPSQLHVISLSDDGVFGQRLRALGVNVIALGMRPNASAILYFHRLVLLIRQLRPNVVQTWMYHADLLGGIAAKLAGIPVCWNVRHSDLSKEHTAIQTRFVARLCAVLSGIVPKLIVSCSARASDIHTGIGYASKFEIIPNGLDLEALRPSVAVRVATRHALQLPANALVVGHVGRADPQKDHPTLLRAFGEVYKRCPNAFLLLAGDGLMRNNSYLEGLLQGVAFKDRVLGLGPRDDIPALMNAMDVFVLSSSFGEAFPNVVAEAMACGVRCVVTDVGDASMIVGDTGWVVPPGNPWTLADSIVSALTGTPSDRNRRQAAAREKVERDYGIARMVAAYNKTWAEACMEQK